MFMGIMYMISFKNDNRDHKVAVESIAQSPISKKKKKFIEGLEKEAIYDMENHIGTIWIQPIPLDLYA